MYSGSPGVGAETSGVGGSLRLEGPLLNRPHCSPDRLSGRSLSHLSVSVNPRRLTEGPLTPLEGGSVSSDKHPAREVESVILM